MTAVALSAPRAEVRASSIFVALLRRDMRVARRELPFFLLRTTMQPLMFVVVFGYLLPKMGFMGSGYTTALLPGVLAISLYLAGNAAWGTRLHNYAVRPLTVWALLLAFAILIAAVGPYLRSRKGTGGLIETAELAASL